MRRTTAIPSATVREKTETVSIVFTQPPPETQALPTRPGVGLTPTMPLKAAGTRPDPAASLAIEKAAKPAATETAEPELDPPEM